MAFASPGWLALLTGVALAAAPVGAQAAGRPRAVPAAAVRTVTIQQMRFGPVPAPLRVGQTVEWVNDDIFVHSATARDHSFDITLKPNARARMRLTRAGVIAFYCRFHPGMTGTLVVGR